MENWKPLSERWKSPQIFCIVPVVWSNKFKIMLNFFLFLMLLFMRELPDIYLFVWLQVIILDACTSVCGVCGSESCERNAHDSKQSSTGSHSSSVSPDPDLVVGSMVEVLGKPPRYGVIRWISTLDGQYNKVIAGLEMVSVRWSGWGCSSVGWSIGPSCCWRRFDSPVQQGIFLPESTFSADSLTCVHTPRVQ